MGAFYFKIENRRNILNTALLFTINNCTQTIINNGGLNINITFNYLKRCKRVDNNTIKIVQLFVVKIVLCH